MADCGCKRAAERAERKTLGVLLAINAGMFLLELSTGLIAHSTALVADSLDMLADATVYGLSLLAIRQSTSRKVRAAFLSGLFQITLAGLLLIDVVRRFIHGSTPEPGFMVGIGLLALVANVCCLTLISKHREGEVHMRASWIFSRNDVIANLGVIVSGLLVYALGSRLPDLIIGFAIAALVLKGGISILKDARKENKLLVEQPLSD